MYNTKMFKGLIYSFISAFAFASMAVFVKIGYAAGLTTKEMLFFRFVFASVFLFLFLLIKYPKKLIINGGLLKKSLLMGGLFYASQSYCFFASIKHISPSITELILYLYPAFVTLLAAIVFKERFDIFKFLYITIILAGFIFIFGDALNSRIRLLGVLLGFAAMVIYSVYLIVVQQFLKNEDVLSLTFYTIVFTTITFFVLFNKDVGALSLKQTGVVVSLGLISTVIAIGFLFLSIDAIGSSLTSVFSSFEPVITIILSGAVLGIGMTLHQIIGAVLILIGVFSANIYHLRFQKDG